jgi:threonine dehydrogenase-like Zn-dependent dehydrogenase
LAAADEAKVRILEVGVCGTDREICEFKFGEAPAGSEFLVLGHEALGEVVEAGPASGFKRGDLVVPMVRMPCVDPTCAACRNDAQDYCLTDSFPERGIRRKHGFMTSLITERGKYLVPVPASLRATAVLVEPLTIIEKALLQYAATEGRKPWAKPERRALVLGAGPVGLLGAMALRVRGYETWVYARSPEDTPNAAVARMIGARYVSGQELPLRRLHEKLGQIDLVYESAGSVPAAFEVMESLGTNGVCILTGVPGVGQALQIDGGRLMRDIVLKNQVILGTVNASREAFQKAIADLELFMQRWPGAVSSILTGRYPLEAYADLLLGRPPGIKNVFTL